MWKLKSFTQADKKTPILEEWFENQTPSVQTAFLNRMKDLIKKPGNGWNRPDVGQLRHECSGLYEIVLKVDKVQYRPIGYYSGKEEFTFVAFALEKGGKFVPPNICKTAFKRIELIKTEGRVCEITI
jgi:hypothetical protein